MIYLPRNDANGIYPGNEYELFYFDLNGWQSLGCKIATGYSIEFENIPSNAVTGYAITRQVRKSAFHNSKWEATLLVK